MDKIKTGILGCTGIVGQQFVRMLDSHPYFEIASLSASPRSAGKRYCETADWVVGGDFPQYVRDMVVTETSVEALLKEKVRVVFSALPAPIARGIEEELARKGLYVFSNASAHRLDLDVPILIPEVNPEHLELINTQIARHRGFIVANSNCSAAGLVLGLKPLLNFGLRSVTVTTYQALSGAGRRGVASLDIVDNLIPYIKDEEEKIERETGKIFGRIHKGGVKNASFEINASCCRVPTRDGHLESVAVELDEDVDIETILNAFNSFRGVPQELKLPTAPDAPVIVRTEENRPQPFLDRYAGTPERAKGMAITVGRIRKKGKKVNFFLLVNNAVRGAAGACILNAEFAVIKNRIR